MPPAGPGRRWLLLRRGQEAGGGGGRQGPGSEARLLALRRPSPSAWQPPAHGREQWGLPPLPAEQAARGGPCHGAAMAAALYMSRLFHPPVAATHEF